MDLPPPQNTDSHFIIRSVEFILRFGRPFSKTGFSKMLPEHVDLLSRAAAIIAIVAAVIQAVAAVVIARLTGKLERVTERYANSTDAAVRASQEHFEREWRPDLRIADVQVVGVGQVFLRIANLAKPPA